MQTKILLSPNRQSEQVKKNGMKTEESKKNGKKNRTNENKAG